MQICVCVKISPVIGRKISEQDCSKNVVKRSNHAKSIESTGSRVIEMWRAIGKGLGGRRNRERERALKKEQKIFYIKGAFTSQNKIVLK